MLNISWLNQAGTGAPSWSKVLTASHVGHCHDPSSLLPTHFPPALSILPSSTFKMPFPRPWLLRGVIHIDLPTETLCCPSFRTLLHSHRISLICSRQSSPHFLLLYFFLFLTWTTNTRTHTGHDKLCFHAFSHAFSQPENLCLHIESQFPTGALQCKLEKPRWETIGSGGEHSKLERAYQV